MVKIEKELRASKLKKRNDPNIWITYLEELCDRLKKMMGLIIKEDQFLIHILNNWSHEYELQVLFIWRKELM